MASRFKVVRQTTRQFSEWNLVQYYTGEREVIVGAVVAYNVVIVVVLYVIFVVLLLNDQVTAVVHKYSSTTRMWKMVLSFSSGSRCPLLPPATVSTLPTSAKRFP